jgi:hypothetical protein
MATQIGIINSALVKIGAATITATTDDSESARASMRIWDQGFDDLLASYPWNCATARATLTALPDAPDSGFDYQFPLPTDPYCLRVIEEVNNYEWHVEGRRLLCDSSAPEIRYIKRATNLGELSSQVAEVMSLWLAKELAFGLTGSAALADRMEARYMERLRKARLEDSAEKRDIPHTSRMNTSWIQERW